MKKKTPCYYFCSIFIILILQVVLDYLVCKDLLRFYLNVDAEIWKAPYPELVNVMTSLNCNSHRF